MIDPVRLLRTPEPFEDESLMGYVLRLTDENSYDTTSWIFDLAGLNITANGWSVLYRPAFDPTALRRVLGLTRAEYGALGYGNVTAGQSMPFSDRYLSAEFIRFSVPKVCPECLREKNYYRRFWDLLPLTSCPAHGLMLIDSCPGCSRRLSWRRKKVSLCRCGYDWRTSRSVAADAAGLEVSRHLLRLCLQSDDKPQTQINGSPIYGLGLGDLCRALTLLAGYHLFVEEGAWVCSRTKNEKCHRAYSYAHRAFAAWPMSFYRFLFRVRHCGRGQIRESRLYRQIETLCDTPSLRFIHIACEDFVEAYEWNASEPGMTRPPTFRRFVEKGEACRRLGIEQVWLDPLIRKGKLVTIHDPYKSRLLIDAESVKLLYESLCKMLSLADVALILGTEAADAEDLIHEGLLKPLSGPTVDGLPEWRFDRQEVADLIDRLDGAMAEHSTAVRDALMAVRAAIRQMRTHGCSPGRCLRAILEGEIVAQTGLTPFPHYPYFVFARDRVPKADRRLITGDEHPGCIEGCEDGRYQGFDYKVRALALERKRNRNLRFHPRRTKRNFTTQLTRFC